MLANSGKMRTCEEAMRQRIAKACLKFRQAIDALIFANIATYGRLRELHVIMAFFARNVYLMVALAMVGA